MSNQEKNFNFFKEETAKKYGHETWGLLQYGTSTKTGMELLTEAAESYARYREEQGRKEGYNQALGDVVSNGLKPFYQAWFTNTADKCRKAILKLKK